MHYNVNGCVCMYVCAELELKIMTNPVYIHKYFLLIVKKSFFVFFCLSIPWYVHLHAIPI
jgi:hypothetical protein